MPTNVAIKETSPSIVNSKKQFFFQPKLSINQPNDIYEQEADAVADKVMRMNGGLADKKFFSPPVIQKKCAHCGEEEKQLQKKEINGSNTIVQRQDENEESQGGQVNMPPSLLQFFFPPLQLNPPTDAIDYLGIRKRLLNRGLSFPGNYLGDAQQEWARQYSFYRQFGLGNLVGNSFAGNALRFFGVKPPGGDWNAWLSNTTTPLAVDSALSRDFPTFSELEERRGGLPNPIIINAPALAF